MAIQAPINNRNKQSKFSFSGNQLFLKKSGKSSRWSSFSKFFLEMRIPGRFLNFQNNWHNWAELLLNSPQYIRHKSSSLRSSSALLCLTYWSITFSQIFIFKSTVGLHRINIEGSGGTLEVYHYSNSKHLNVHLKVYSVFNRVIYMCHQLKVKCSIQEKAGLPKVIYAVQPN